MQLTRRQLIVLAGAAALGGCAESSGTAPAPALSHGPVEVGSLADYSKEGIYSQFHRSHGFFMIREGDHLFAQSGICTHRACALKARGSDFLCPCHGSTFTLAGHVTRGPARRDLPRFEIHKFETGQVIVHTDRPIWPERFDLPAARVVVGSR